MANSFIKGLYDMSTYKGEDGETKFDDAKLKRQLAADNKTGRRNKDAFSEGESRFYTCKLYEPCQLCDKCMTKASHLYVRCQNCLIPICGHKHKDRVRMIRRENFKIGGLSPRTKEAIKALGNSVLINK